MRNKGRDFPEVMSAKDASAYLDIAEKTLYRLIREENIPSFKLGREWRFKKSLLEEWLGQRMGSQSAPQSDDGGRDASIPAEIKKLLNEAVQKLTRDYHPEKIILYGSYAYGHPTPDSDIDLLIVRETDKKRVDRFVEVNRMLYRPGRRVSISPLVYTPHEIEQRVSLGDDFIREILTRGHVLYG